MMLGGFPLWRAENQVFDLLRLILEQAVDAY